MVWRDAGKLARLAAYEQAPLEETAKRIDLKQRPFLTRAEHQEDIEWLVQEINAPPEDHACICGGYVTWCRCRRIEHPACACLNFEWDEIADHSADIPRGSRHFFKERATYLTGRGIQLPLATEAFLLYSEWCELTGEERARYAEEEGYTEEEYYKKKLHWSQVFNTQIVLHAEILKRSNIALLDRHCESCEQGIVPTLPQLAHWFSEFLGFKS